MGIGFMNLPVFECFVRSWQMYLDVNGIRDKPCLEARGERSEGAGVNDSPVDCQSLVGNREKAPLEARGAVSES